MVRQWEDPDRAEREATGSPEGTRLLVIAMLAAMAVGLACGVVWTAYHLFKNWLGD